MDGVRLIHGDCTTELKALPDASVDCIITDPPYPCIRRSYGTWTEAEWFSMMRVVVPECMRILKPTGSAVFILQPNSERVGKMRTWLWKFKAWVGDEFGIIQDAYWWNHTALPTVHCHRTKGLMRPSVKSAVWVGSPNCYRDQSSVLWAESDANKALKADARCTNRLAYRPAGYAMRDERSRRVTDERGGTTPFNLLPIAGRSATDGSDNEHGARTPDPLAHWWLRYICPSGGTVLDPFSGSGTVALAALKQGKRAIGIERIEEYHRIAEKRIEAAQQELPLFAKAQSVPTTEVVTA